MDTFPVSVANEVRDVAWRSAWMAANDVANYPFDAAADKASVAQHFAALKEEVSKLALNLTDDLLNDVRMMALHAGWHTAYLRQGRARAAAEALAEFENMATAVALATDEVTVRLADEVRWLCWNASWHAANSRTGYAKDAARDLLGFNAHWRGMIQAPYFGVNLGGWLLLERWQCGSLFADYTEAQAPDEFSLSQCLGAAAAAEKIGAWRDTWITRSDFEAIKDKGFNSVRLPFGWWTVDGVEEEAGVDVGPFVGRGMKHVDSAVQWAEELGLSVVLDLHSGVGFQSGHHATGRENPKWKPSDWNTAATVRVLTIVAERYKGAKSVTGICVINEPSNEVAGDVLVAFYRSAYAAIRAAGMVNVDVFFPVYQRSLSEFTSRSFPDTSMVRAVLDLHMYQCFGGTWTCLTLKQHLARASDGGGHWPGMVEVAAAGQLCAVSEWSLRLPDWDPSYGMFAEWATLNEEQRGAALREYGARQVKQYERGNGWFFWCWKVDVPGEGEPWWSAQQCFERGWMDRVDWVKGA
mmetsp:Transcript_15406/g.30416  ORF Transcript_15406/g.30416 Transcript_15406/m.30416 type:complete len:525 (-) Transcript_15406:58-1632(-)|eukprot:CAMPEP_0173406298 /NCGR_PEP_ID=MMETSP1356-20130122/64282_1 /TAXON_ID=77927 ORGANISM="Hemiselmis virescens, Strain PCC157" /NCGR_SAMPLE_ID=MMETSP1356 /ASSEMBLY_ACC=CAM_ASM_000847 /LENGTH=524 /DNA_ID=CAMNT_0014367267 /DNA_START=218 /DNA_END=1792 /DNA_ORIENTATION=+